jgi:hypothetical protein
MLFQINAGGDEMPISFLSKAFNTTEQKWSTIEQEAFAIFHAVMSFCHYLRGHRFTIQTDHRNLVFIEKSEAPKIVRWRLRLQAYDFDIVHIPGKSNVVPDVLSRCLHIASQDITHVLSLCLTVTDDHSDLISTVHNCVVGHRGINHSVTRLKMLGHNWSGMKSEVSTFIESCPTCQKTRLAGPHTDVREGNIMSSEPYETISIDIAGPYPEDDYKNKYIIAVVDNFTRFTELFARPAQTARAVAECLLDVFGRYGAPKKVRSDQGTQFTSDLIKEFLQLVGSKQLLTVAYHPQANGMVERINAEIGRHLRALVMDKRIHGDWSISLPLIQRILNSTPHAVLGATPAELLYGQAVSLDRQLLQLPVQAHTETSYDLYMQKLLTTQSALMGEAREKQSNHIKRHQAKAPATSTSYAVGTHVLVSHPTRAPSKISPVWKGPYFITARRKDVYECLHMSDNETNEFHVSRLKPYDATRTPSLIEVAAIDRNEHTVNKILDHAPMGKNITHKTNQQYLVHWEAQPTEDTWEPWLHVRKCKAMDVYLKSCHPKLK